MNTADLFGPTILSSERAQNDNSLSFPTALPWMGPSLFPWEWNVSQLHMWRKKKAFNFRSKMQEIC